MDKSREYYVKWNKSDSERQIPYDLTCMWNLKEKTQPIKPNRTKQTHTLREQMNGCQKRGDKGCGGNRWWGLRGTYLSYIINKSQGCDIQRKEYDEQYCYNFVWGQMVTRLIVEIIS